MWMGRGEKLVEKVLSLSEKGSNGARRRRTNGEKTIWKRKKGLKGPLSFPRCQMRACVCL